MSAGRGRGAIRFASVMREPQATITRPRAARTGLF
jgi:hypothetical protein